MVDHYMTNAIWKVNASRSRSKKSRIIETRSLRNYDKEKFLHDQKEMNWEQMLSPFSESPDQRKRLSDVTLNRPTGKP